MIPLMKVFMAPQEELIPTLTTVLYSGTITEGKKVREFEARLQQKFNFPSVPLTVNSGTSALQLAYRCAGARDKIVLTTPMTCTATNMPILQEGGRIVWCDIDPTTGNISVEDVVNKIKEYGASNIAAIAFVDFAGYPAHLGDLIAVSKRYGIPLVEDAAQSLGAKWDNQYVGSNPNVDYTCFSFQAIKHLTTVDGGALVVSDPEKWELAKRLKWYGINREAVKEATRWHYDIPDWGYKAHMNNVAATIGLSQLKHIDKVIEAHKANGKFFDQALSTVEGLEQLHVSEKSDPSYWIYMIKVKEREAFAKKMAKANIGVNVAHIRNDNYSCFLSKEHVLNPHERRPGLDSFNNEYIAIPSGWWLSERDRDYILSTIKKGWNEL